MCLGFKNLYIAVLFVLSVGWFQLWFMVILFLTFYLLVLNFQDWPEELGSFSGVGLFFMYGKLQYDLFQISNFFYWYGLQWLLPLNFQIIHIEVLPSLLFLILCTFINRANNMLPLPLLLYHWLSSRLIIFINALDRFLSLKETWIMVSGLLCKINSFWSCWLNSTLMIEYWRVDLEPL